MIYDWQMVDRLETAPSRFLVEGFLSRRGGDSKVIAPSYENPVCAPVVRACQPRSRKELRWLRDQLFGELSSCLELGSLVPSTVDRHELFKYGLPYLQLWLNIEAGP